MYNLRSNHRSYLLGQAEKFYAIRPVAHRVERDQGAYNDRVPTTSSAPNSITQGASHYHFPMKSFHRSYEKAFDPCLSRALQEPCSCIP